MRADLPQACREIAELQGGVISRAQALKCGISPSAIDRLLGAGRWLSLRRGVYSVYTGQPSREAALWAVVLLAGEGAALSHQTAAELFKITDQPSSLIHVTLPHSRRMSPATGVVIHRSTRVAEATHPALLPPRTRIEETVLDLAEQATDFEAAFGVVCAASQRRLTTCDRVSEAMGRRQRMRWRAELVQALGLVSTGVHSLLEYRYVHLVEQPHGLPLATRQAKVVPGGRSRYLDNLYSGYQLCVELDGQQAHPDDQRWQDLRRINSLTEQGMTVLRYGWIDVDRHPCQTAAQIAVVLRTLGWPGPVRRCSHTCPIFAIIRATQSHLATTSS